MSRGKPARTPKSATKTEIVAFKVEQDLADFLNKLPNKSDFIRKAIIAAVRDDLPAMHWFRGSRPGSSQPLQADHHREQHASLRPLRVLAVGAYQHRRHLVR